MTASVRYYTRSGNTKRMAEAAAEVLGLEALTVEEDLSEKTELLFLGSAMYAWNADKSVVAFLSRNREKIGKIVVFGSSASGKSTHAKLAECAETLGIAIDPDYYSCPGHFLFMNKERPNEADLEALKAFVKTKAALS